ncbi:MULTISPECIES: Fic family protein [unclassified Facklamia]|uniref:Fic family protein n=1 Tax=Aerococcaceae TaxID=186827 RepID=UPI001F07CABF|nr:MULTISPECIES: Fic family protein [unclassified Facklamia]
MIIEKFKPLSSYETPLAINNICGELNRALDEKVVDALLLIPIFIHDFLCIHPFNDGNGRMSRLLTTLLLYRQGYVIGKYISLESKIEKNQGSYYFSLERSGIHWHENEEDVTYFIKYILRMILASYIDFEERVDYVGEKKPTIELVRSAVDNKLGKFTKSDIMERVPSVRKATIENMLKQ